GAWSTERGVNLLDGGAPFYDVYETSDGRYVAVGALEPQFYDALLKGLELDGELLPPRTDRSRWPELRERFGQVFRSRTRAEWSRVFEGTAAAVPPVLSMDEAPAHPHNTARGTFVNVDGIPQPAPAPRFSRTPSTSSRPPASGADTAAVLSSLGFDDDELG